MPRAALAGAHPAARLNSFDHSRHRRRGEDKMAHYQGALGSRCIGGPGGIWRKFTARRGRPEFETASFSVMWRITEVAGTRGRKSLPMANCGMCVGVNITGEPRATNIC